VATTTGPEIRELEAGETGRAFAAMIELRTAFADDRDRFIAQIDQQQRPQGYRLFAAFEPDAPPDADAAAVAGFRRAVFLAWGDVLYLAAGYEIRSHHLVKRL
jgi:hypothetical protein